MVGALEGGGGGLAAVPSPFCNGYNLKSEYFSTFLMNRYGH